MSEVDVDTIVIGGGAIGLPAAYYSASAGKSTILFEKNSFYHDQGSSGGNSRFFRMMYSEESMAMLSETSYALWKQAEVETGLQLLDEQPLLFFGNKDSGKTVEGDFGNADTVMKNLGIPFDRLNSQETLTRYPAFKALPKDYVGLVQRNSAVIKAENFLKAYHGLATNAGAKLYDNTSAYISGVSDCGKIITVETPKGTFRTRSLIVSIGAWGNNLLKPLGIQFDLKIWQMTVAFYKTLNPNQIYPFWYEFGAPDKLGQNLFYGFPAGTDNAGHIKVSCDFTTDIYDDITQCSRKPNTEILEMISDHVRKRFHDVDPNPGDVKTCMYTMSSDYHMILGLLPGYKNISILTGESGRAFKYAPLFGRILSQLAHHGETPYNIDSISINRPNILKT